MKILIWHVHGGWMDSFVHGPHEYLVPVNAQRDAWGLGTGGRDWPASVREVSQEQLAEEHIDVVVLQRPEELAEVHRLTGRVPGSELPAAGSVPITYHLPTVLEDSLRTSGT